MGQDAQALEVFQAVKGVLAAVSENGAGAAWAYAGDAQQLVQVGGVDLHRRLVQVGARPVLPAAPSVDGTLAHEQPASRAVSF